MTDNLSGASILDDGAIERAFAIRDKMIDVARARAGTWGATQGEMREAQGEYLASVLGATNEALHYAGMALASGNKQMMALALEKVNAALALETGK